MYNSSDIKDLASGNMKWKKNKGFGYAKGGKGIEKNPNSLRRPGNYGCDCPTGRSIIRREKSKSEINALMRG